MSCLRWIVHTSCALPGLVCCYDAVQAIIEEYNIEELWWCSCAGSLSKGVAGKRKSRILRMNRAKTLLLPKYTLFQVHEIVYIIGNEVSTHSQIQICMAFNCAISVRPFTSRPKWQELPVVLLTAKCLTEENVWTPGTISLQHLNSKLVVLLQLCSGFNANPSDFQGWWAHR